MDKALGEQIRLMAWRESLDGEAPKAAWQYHLAGVRTADINLKIHVLAKEIWHNLIVTPPEVEELYRQI